MASVVEIIYDEDGPDEVDIAANAVIQSATFGVSASAHPDTCEIILKDPSRTLEFVTGRRLKLIVDGRPMWAGFTLVLGRSSFFSAGDGLEDTMARKWILRGVDNNILLDKRVLRRAANYLIAIPNITTNTYDGAILRQGLEDYADMPSWLDIDSFIDDVQVPASTSGGNITAADPWAWPQQGSKIRDLFDNVALNSAAVFYIGPDDAVHYHAIQDRESSWGFSDRPNNAAIVSSSGGFEDAYYGFREMNAIEDGSDFVTDAFVWGGSEFAGSGGTVFARATDTDLEDAHNKWQRAETHFGEKFFKTQPTVTQRANMIVFGNADGDPSGAEPGTVAGEGPRGLRFPQWSYTFTWFNVPEISGSPVHIYPGDVVPIELWAFSQDGGTTPFHKWLPLRQLKISFASGTATGETIVRFDGTFDLRNQDSKFLWTYLRQRQNRPFQQITVVNNSSPVAPYGAFGQFIPTPAPDAVETVFTIPFGYIPGTTQVWVDGNNVPLVLSVDYQETDNLAGELTLDDAPSDSIFVTCRTLAG